jgi:hypothetical protein
MEILRETIWGGTPYLYELAVRARLEELPPEVREALEDLFGGDLPDPVVLVAGHYQAEPGDEEVYLLLRGEGDRVLGRWDAERFKEAAEVWRWVMGVNEEKAA